MGSYSSGTVFSVYLLYLGGDLFLYVWDVFFYEVIENILSAFIMVFFSFCNTHNLKVRSFHGVTKFSFVLFNLSLSLTDWSTFVFHVSILCMRLSIEIFVGLLSFSFPLSF